MGRRRKKLPSAGGNSRAQRGRAPEQSPRRPADSAPLRPQDWLLALALAVAVFAVYLPAWHGGFVWDDDLHLLNNPVLRPGGVLGTWVPGTYVNYWPLTSTVYWLEYQLWGLAPLGFHLVNIGLHAVSAILVWRVLARLRLPGALLAAALFALHPVIGWVTFAFALVLAVLPKPALAVHGGPDSATIKRALLLSRLTLFGALVAFMANWGMQCLYSLTPTFLAADRPVGIGYGAMTSAQLMLGVTLLAGIAGPMICGVLLDKVFKGNTKPVFLMGFALMCVFVYLLTFPAITSNVPALEIVLILAGFGPPFTITSIYYFVARSYAPQVVGITTGVWMGIGTFGGAVGLFVAGVTIKSQNSYHTSLVMQSRRPGRLPAGLRSDLARMTPKDELVRLRHRKCDENESLVE